MSIYVQLFKAAMDKGVPEGYKTLLRYLDAWSIAGRPSIDRMVEHDTKMFVWQLFAYACDRKAWLEGVQEEIGAWEDPNKELPEVIAKLIAETQKAIDLLGPPKKVIEQD